MNLDDLREKIDHIDNEILRLLVGRMELALRTRALKTDVGDPDRESEILRRSARFTAACPVISEDFTTRLFTAVMEESRRIQMAGQTLIGFQGEHGAFSEAAARIYDHALVTVPFPEFADVFEAVEEGTLDLGIVPVENSLAGAVFTVNDLLTRTSLKVAGALKTKINLCLLKLPETNHQEIRIVSSHPQALAQCRDFISRHNFESVPHYDTAGAARMLAREKPRLTAVIANRLCAELYGLEVVKENIEDHARNITRFLILSRQEKAGGANKCSLIFSVPHQTGALFKVLRIFAEAGINLTRIESFPDRHAPERYSFFLDFQSDTIEADRKRVLAELAANTVHLKDLGCYREIPMV